MYVNNDLSPVAPVAAKALECAVLTFKGVLKSSAQTLSGQSRSVPTRISRPLSEVSGIVTFLPDHYRAHSILTK